MTGIKILLEKIRDMKVNVRENLFVMFLRYSSLIPLAGFLAYKVNLKYLKKKKRGNGKII